MDTNYSTSNNSTQSNIKLKHDELYNEEEDILSNYSNDTSDGHVVRTIHSLNKQRNSKQILTDTGTKIINGNKPPLIKATNNNKSRKFSAKNLNRGNSNMNIKDYKVENAMTIN